MLSVTGLHKSFAGRRAGSPSVIALDGVDLEVEEGTFATVLGPSGSGKTTLLRCIAGFEHPDRGRIVLAARTLDAPNRSPVRPDQRGIGIVPQEGALFPHLTVAQNIGFGLRERSRSERRERIGTLLRLIDLPGHERRRPHQLSGGQQQRVALARALAPEPRLILLDEPYSALDANLRVDLRHQVRELLRSIGTTAILVTHDRSEALTIADHLIVMRNGRIVASGPPRDVYRDPTDLDLAGFLGDATVVDGRIGRDGTEVRCPLGRLPVANPTGASSANGRCRVLIRPEQLTVDPVGPDDAGADPLVGTVQSSVFHGDHSVLGIALSGGDEPVIAKVLGVDHPEPGDRVRLRVRGTVRIYPG